MPLQLAVQGPKTDDACVPLWVGLLGLKLYDSTATAGLATSYCFGVTQWVSQFMQGGGLLLMLFYAIRHAMLCYAMLRYAIMCTITKRALSRATHDFFRSTHLWVVPGCAQKVTGTELLGAASRSVCVVGGG